MADGSLIDLHEKDAQRLWHVTLTMAGQAVPAAEILAGLERLTDERPFLLGARYAPDRAEVRYWEEARDLDDAAALALRLWGEHRRSATLPLWHVVGLEIIDRATYRRRAREDRSLRTRVPTSGVRPF